MDVKNLVKEGRAEVLYPSYVFYNPVQEFNRDLTIAVISEYAKDKLKISKQENKSQVKIEGKQDEHMQVKMSFLWMNVQEENCNTL